jgi:ribosome biogenesis GTPase A
MILLTDYRTGTLGRISLETPASRQAMLAAAASKAKKATDKAADKDPDTAA